MNSYRKRLLASTVTSILGGVAMIAPQSASAACVVAGNTVTCATNTTTIDTPFPVNPPNDRAYQFISPPLTTTFLDVDPTVLAGHSAASE